MSRQLQDQFVDDDEEEVCPLCVEEFDLSDKNFRPCPCGYQICQFCYNNIKTTMNGLCPACRRPYDEKSIEFKNVTAEELAMHKAEIAQKAKKNAALRQKEKQKVEADNLSRKHLAGLRVVQKNLVYVTGLTPTIQDDSLHEMLRGNEYFGQYGKIIKIVVSKAKDTAHSNSVGVYVTFSRKEDATACIAAVDGSQNGPRTLRAQYGTTKYCSAYLRNETCNNRNCMFLHEAGEENDSFTRQDLSSMNVISTQQPAQSLAPHSDANPLQPQPPPQRAPQGIAAAAPPMNRQDSNEAPASPTNSGGGAALPSTANWGNKPSQGRRASRSTNASTSSPMTTNAVPVTQPPTKTDPEPSKQRGKETVKNGSQKSAQPSKSSTPQPPLSARERRGVSDLDHILKAIASPDFKFVFSAASLTPQEFEVISNFPQLLDPNGGAKRRAMKDKQEQAAEQALVSIAPNIEPEDNPEGGSLQLGGEPEEHHETAPGRGHQHVIAPPSQQTMGLGFGQGLADDFGGLGLNGRGLTVQQQQQLMLLKSAAPQSAGLMSNLQGHGQQQQALGQQQSGSAPGHARHTSRFSFANDSATASAAVQPVANAKLMNQQSSMMPKNTNHFNQLGQHQALGNQYYTSGMQAPPGLKATGTPPVSGGGMFGQGHGFTTGGVGYGTNAMGRPNESYQDLLRERGTGARGPDAGKRESMFPSFLHQQHPTTSTPAPAPGLLSFPYGASPGAYQDSGPQKQKKKGKKHRHANTSSSGGGGVVDVADPSILQARLHQGGAMGGQGLYGGQGQGGFPSMYNNNNFGVGGRW
ncbi:uncharacterized protein BDZ99DRAFT_148137 [Mytilinidion resinicola]|uniref:CCR4-NOT core complex subunit Not4 n=1 Tax=Mytilinidion resinicola TaxID=574789 RepID=A0A6A6Y7D3_9PEZI|nr:uncharacterized protein BDZ99DRAFT_148137 [Mytilinidion resinicola]KAF2804600.1 hypothetical protein BDZ99DRAFT_148137 [Mytilinidion resinicola]